MTGLHALFPDLDPAAHADLEAFLQTDSYPAGHIFHMPNEIGRYVFFLQQGRVRIYKLSPEGRALTLLVLHPPSLFGEMALIGDGIHDTCAEAMTDCVVARIDREVLRSFLGRQPRAAIDLMELMGTRLRAMEQRLADIAFKSVPQRLAALLLDLAGDPVDGAAPATLVRYTHQQLAEMIGAYRETVTKALGDMREANLIRIADDAIILVDPVQLRRLAS
ncbi:Crp/Fnr family transcriptional regulator [Chloroflexus sp.]|uniref:Crp/Fnr family transcriptional regulator n=1 Tax=Chloroflexus sp. TaxID=1904827 RepID=UPI0026120760|nr:Crp/Fnr family transcriptional regulator [uncultured Chloroflexus sp.]